MPGWKWSPVQHAFQLRGLSQGIEGSHVWRLEGLQLQPDGRGNLWDGRCKIRCRGWRRWVAHMWFLLFHDMCPSSAEAGEECTVQDSIQGQCVFVYVLSRFGWVIWLVVHGLICSRHVNFVSLTLQESVLESKSWVGKTANLQTKVTRVELSDCSLQPWGIHLFTVQQEGDNSVGAVPDWSCHHFEASQDTLWGCTSLAETSQSWDWQCLHCAGCIGDCFPASDTCSIDSIIFLVCSCWLPWSGWWLAQKNSQTLQFRKSKKNRVSRARRLSCYSYELWVVSINYILNL